jgi:hypothetical protein
VDTIKSRAGRLGARARWGDPGVVNLAELTPAQRRLVLALISAAAAENKKAPVVSETPTEATLPEDHDDGRPEAA